MIRIENSSRELKYLKCELIIAEKVKEKGEEKMKTKLLAVVFVALLAMSIAPAFSYEPPVPGQPFVHYIDPQELKFTGPCTESQRFTAKVMVYQVLDLYAWDILVKWDNASLILESYELKVPAGWPVGGYNILIDDLDWESLHFAVTRLGLVSGFNGTMSLADLYFHVVAEPCWNTGCITTVIDINNATSMFSTACGIRMYPQIVEDGTIKINPSKPNMEILFSNTFNLTKKKALGYYEEQVITAYVWVSNATKLYGIEAEVTWDSDLLEIDLQQITINTEAFPGPWTLLIQELIPGDFYFEVLRPEPPIKPPIKGTFWILKMEFKVKCYEEDYIPINGTCTIGFNPAWTGLLMCGTWYMGTDSQAIDLSTATYYWRPIKYDFTQNGHVGVEDILEALDHYGEDRTGMVAGQGFDFDNDNDVDIYDIVKVAKAYCHSTPPPMPP